MKLKIEKMIYRVLCVKEESKMAFADIPVSTQTFTVRSNIQHIELQKFYDELKPMGPAPQVSGPMCKREATILCIKYQQQKKGYDPEKDQKSKRKRKEQESTKRNFLNCITLIIQVEKRINIKIFKNGVFQLTGCKEIDNVRRCLKLILSELDKTNKANDPSSYFTLQEGYESFIIYIKSAMRNIDFDLGFKVNRSILSKRLTCLYKEDDNVIIPDAIGNKMDVKIKIRVTRENLEHLPITKITNPINDKPKEEIVLYKDCLHIIEPDKKKLESKMKDKFVSISVFQNGKVLLSAMDASIQEQYYEWFTELIGSIEVDIKPQILPKKTFLIGKSRQKMKLNI
jgi:hypothetical protein